ncbi:MAG: hypothetical protein SFT92_03925 [Rickettsiales bacterium]|nr:hypothetical protein [Rickettsiales bacterium]
MADLTFDIAPNTRYTVERDGNENGYVLSPPDGQGKALHFSSNDTVSLTGDGKGSIIAFGNIAEEELRDKIKPRNTGVQFSTKAASNPGPAIGPDSATSITYGARGANNANGGAINKYVEWQKTGGRISLDSSQVASADPFNLGVMPSPSIQGAPPPAPTPSRGGGKRF